MSEEKQHAIQAARGFLPLWGVLGVVAFLTNGLRRVLPIALEPLRSAQPMTASHVLSYVGFGLFMAYFEGYKGFHKKFSPNVVTRAMTLRDARATLISRILAPLYCMELFNAPPSRIVSAWSFLTSIFMVVAAVKRLPPLPRSVVDAGVCIGMSCGTMSILYHYVNAAFRGVLPPAHLEATGASLCPVTLLSTAVGGTIKLIVRGVLGTAAVERLEQHGAHLLSSGKGFLKCPISGKNGASEAECPVARFVAQAGIATPAECAPATKQRTD